MTSDNLPSSLTTNPFADAVSLQHPPPPGPPPGHTETVATSEVPPVTHDTIPEPTPAAAPAPTDHIETVTSNQPQNTDPRITGLKAMFPDFDDAILLSVLSSANGNQDRAVDILLGMNDPNFVSPPEAQVPAHNQTDLDEEYARQLMMEDQRSQNWQPATGYGGGRHGQGYAPGSQNANQGPGLEEQFNKFAETGKKTFSNLFSKVKQKVNEWDQNRQQQQQGGSGQQQSFWSGAPGATNDNPDHGPPITLNSGQTPPVQQQSSRWDPSTAYYDDPAQPASNTAAPVSGSEPVAQPPMQIPSTGSTAQPTTAPAAASGPPQVNRGSIGMYNKEPVSLLANNPPGTTSHRKPVDDDDLEYTENPFEERK